MIQAAHRRPDVVRALEWAAGALPAPVRLEPFTMSPPAHRDILMRLSFSALVDADFLDTEAHFDHDRSSRRRVAQRSIAELEHRSDGAHAEFLSGRSDRSRVDRVRADIREAALRAAALPPGLFRLTVPTGGGKTRSGLAFALRHARTWGLRRVVVAVPFLTITDQTAAVFRDVLGAAAVLVEHCLTVPRAID